MEAWDVHAHVIVPEVLGDGPSGPPWGPRVTREADRSVVELGDRTLRNMLHECVDVEGLLATQERLGITRTVLCPWVPLLFFDLDPREAAARVELQNEGLARMRRAHPDRVLILGAVPLQDPGLAAGSLRDLMSSGDFAGVEITASIAGAYLGEERFEPFWEAAEETAALVFVHPTTRGFQAPVFDRHYLSNLVGNPMETTIAAADLLLSGTIERHPGLRVLLAHGGGALAALRGRLRRGHLAVAAASEDAQEPPDRGLRHFLYDTVTHDPQVLRTLVQTVGADRVMLGSDYPFDMGDPDPVGTVRAAGLDAQEEAAILAGNVERLLGSGGGG